MHMKKKNGDLIYKAAHEIREAAGPWNLDANGWRRILTSSSFGHKSWDLCSAIALIAKKLCLKRYCGNDGSLEAFLACKLISVDKNPEARPIGIGEGIGRILGRVVMTTFRRNILKNASDLQLCKGHRAGCEAAVHSLSSIFSEDDIDAILLVDADNAFNRINRDVMLQNIQIICPIISTHVINSFIMCWDLFRY